MRKLVFYPKLALGNLWRNKNTYLPYLLACVVSIFTLYTLLAINNSTTLDGIRGENVVKSFTATGAVILAIFCSILIFYTNSFLIRRRKKELGLYSILGMEKKNIAVVMFFETLFVACMALVAGLALGMLLSRLLFWVLLRLVRFKVMVDLSISLTAMGTTMAFFGVVFLLALGSNLRQVHMANPAALFAGGRQGEREPKASWLLTILGLVCLAGGYFVALYYTSPMEVIVLFLLAVALVIAGTYCLFTSGSVALLKLLRKNKRYYYQPGHFISVSGMIYRMKQNAAGLATICILSCMVLVTVSSTVSLNMGTEDSLAVQYPYDASLQYADAPEAAAGLAAARVAALESGAEISGLQQYRSVYFTAREVAPGMLTAAQDTGVQLMDGVELFLLKDYNQNENAAETLAPDEALLLVTGGQYDGRVLTVNGVPCTVRSTANIGKVTNGSRSLGRGFTLVLPDEAAIAAVLAGFPAGVTQPVAWHQLEFDLQGDNEVQKAFAQSFREHAPEPQNPARYRFKAENRESWYAANGGFLFLGLYFGILFLLAAVLIIYYKQMSEGYDDAERFEILQKVGMGEAEVRRTINRQILAVFFLPLVVAVVHVAVAFLPISRAMVLFGVFNLPLLLAATGLTVLAYAAVYWLVFRRTARTYFGIVRRKTAA